MSHSKPNIGHFNLNNMKKEYFNLNQIYLIYLYNYLVTIQRV